MGGGVVFTTEGERALALSAANSRGVLTTGAVDAHNKRYTLATAPPPCPSLLSIQWYLPLENEERRNSRCVIPVAVYTRVYPPFSFNPVGDLPNARTDFGLSFCRATMPHCHRPIIRQSIIVSLFGHFHVSI